MTTLAEPIVYTPEEIERLSHESGITYELKNGRLVDKREGDVRMSMESTAAASEITCLLRANYPKTRAYLFVEQPTYCFDDPTEMRKPDVAMVWTERLPQGLSRGELQIPPDLVIEVASPSNKWDDLLDRVDEYLRAGVPLVWVVDPPRRWLHVYRQDGSTALFRTTDTVKDEPLLPGLKLRVDDIFPALTLTTP